MKTHKYFFLTDALCATLLLSLFIITPASAGVTEPILENFNKFNFSGDLKLRSEYEKNRKVIF